MTGELFENASKHEYTASLSVFLSLRGGQRGGAQQITSGSATPVKDPHPTVRHHLLLSET